MERADCIGSRGSQGTQDREEERQLAEEWEIVGRK